MNIEGMLTTQTAPLPDSHLGSCDFNLNDQPPQDGYDEHESSIAPPVIPWASPLATPLEVWPRVFPGL
jgi:hypothetical protein